VFTALDQRVAVRYAIGGLSPAETQSYVTHNAARLVMRRCPRLSP